MPVLSDDFLKRAALGDKPERMFRDSRLPGFTLRLRRRSDGSVSKLFLFIQELPGADGKRRRRKITIGEHPAFTADKARKEAEGMVRALRRGDDPGAIRAAKRAQPTFDELVEDFKTTHLAEKKPGTRKDYLGRIERNLLPAFKGRRVADITPEMVRELMRRKRANPIDANRSLAVLSVMMRRAIELGYRKDNPAHGIKRNRETARERWLDEQELPKFVAALANAQGAYADCIRFLTVTGWRVSEARLLTWDMIDLPRMIARLPDTKTGAAVRALSTDAARILDAQGHRLGFAFSNRKGLQPVDYGALLEALADVCRAAGIDPITPHVLRHTAATWAAISGAEAHELREAFGWKTLAMTARYVSRSESLARRGAQRAAEAVNLFQKPQADVARIKG